MLRKTLALTSLVLAGFIGGCDSDDSSPSTQCGDNGHAVKVLTVSLVNGVVDENDTHERGYCLESERCVYLYKLEDGKLVEDKTSACSAVGQSKLLCNGETVYALTDAKNCGSCGNVCADGRSCIQGVCESACVSGSKRCSGNNLEVCDGNDWNVSKVCENGCSNNDCNAKTDSGSGDDEDSTTVEVTPVPESQDNTKGASCKRANFVEHCSGNDLVFCSLGKVTYDSCSDYDDSNATYSCAVARKNGANYVDCVAQNGTDSCSKANASSNYCDVDDANSYESMQYQICLRFNDGKLHKVNDDFEYCGNLCDEGCKEQAYCDASYTDYCEGNVAYICEVLQEKYYAKRCANSCKEEYNKVVCK